MATTDEIMVDLASDELWKISDKVEPYNDVTLLLALYPDVQWEPSLARSPCISWNRYLIAMRDKEHWAMVSDFWSAGQKVFVAQSAMSANPNVPKDVIRSVAAGPNKMNVASNPQLTPADAAKVLVGKHNILSLGSTVSSVASNPGLAITDLENMFDVDKLNQLAKTKFDEELAERADKIARGQNPDVKVITGNRYASDKEREQAHRESMAHIQNDLICNAFAEGISANPNITTNFLDRYPHLRYIKSELAKNPVFTLADVTKYKLYNCDLAQNSTVYKELIDGVDVVDWRKVIDNPPASVVALHSAIVEYYDVDQKMGFCADNKAGLSYHYSKVNAFMRTMLFAHAPIDVSYLDWYLTEQACEALQILQCGGVYYTRDAIRPLQHNPNLTWLHIHTLLQKAVSRNIDIYNRRGPGQPYYEMVLIICSSFKQVRKYSTPADFGKTSLRHMTKEEIETLVKQIN